MPYAIEMFFDIKAETYIFDIWKKLFENEIVSYMLNNNWRPHISLSVYNKLNIEIAEKNLFKFCSNKKKLKVFLGSIGIFPSDENVLFVAPIVTEELLKLHKSYHEEFASFRDDIWEYYLPGKWQPHCTMALKIPKEKFADSVIILKKHFKPIEVCVETMGLIEFEPTKIIKEYSLE